MWLVWFPRCFDRTTTGWCVMQDAVTATALFTNVRAEAGGPHQEPEIYPRACYLLHVFLSPLCGTSSRESSLPSPATACMHTQLVNTICLSRVITNLLASTCVPMHVTCACVCNVSQVLSKTLCRVPPQSELSQNSCRSRWHSVRVWGTVTSCSAFVSCRCACA